MVNTDDAESRRLLFTVLLTSNRVNKLARGPFSEKNLDIFAGDLLFVAGGGRAESSSLETELELLLELDDVLDVAEQLDDVVGRDELLVLQRLQVALDEAVHVLVKTRYQS